MVSLPQPGHARQIRPPAVPLNLQVDLRNNEAFLEGNALGTQNYICLPTDDGFQFMLFTPEATLFDSIDGKQVTTHFISVNPNPSDGGKIRATWQHSKDTSTVWGGSAIPSTDPAFVKPDAIAWILLPMAGVKNGPKPGDNILSVTTYIQRVHTSKGLAPVVGCANLNDVGNKAFVPAPWRRLPPGWWCRISIFADLPDKSPAAALHAANDPLPCATALRAALRRDANAESEKIRSPKRCQSNRPR